MGKSERSKMIVEQLEKEKLIKAETNKFKKIFKGISKDKAKTLETLIGNAAFLRINLETLQQDLLENGLTELFEQGEQAFMRERPEVKVYSTFLQRYTGVMKQLIDCMPEDDKKDNGNELMEFLNKSKVKKK